jgi:tetratricopeptide (TPR) repeat protein
VLVYTGHNEYLTPEVRDAGGIAHVLAELRFYQLAVRAGTAWRRWRHGPMDERSLASPDQPYGAARLRALGRATLTAAEHAQILARFEENLGAIVDDVRAAGALPVLTSIAQDLRDSAPGAWRHAPGLSQAAATRWRRYAEDGDARRRARDCPAALAAFHGAMRIDRRPAALHYARARCLEALGRFRTARREYQRASDLDEAPLGAPSTVNRRTRSVAARTGAPFIDVEHAVERASVHRLVGRRWFVDGIHPSLAGHQLIAATIAAAFRRRGLPVPGDDWSSGAYCEPDPAAILREHPRLARREYESRILLHVMLGRSDRALREVRDGEERFPELRAAAQQIATFVRTDTGEPRIKSAWR